MTLEFQVIIFYDGECALCHGFVRYVLSIDHKESCCFAPQQGDLAISLLPESILSKNSVVVYLVSDGRTFYRSAAVRLVLQTVDSKRIFDRVIGGLLALLPVVIADFFYNVIAFLRKYFTPLQSLCPVLPEKYRRRVIMKPSSELLQSLKRVHE